MSITVEETPSGSAAMAALVAEIVSLAEDDRPSLRYLVKELGPSNPLKGKKITLCYKKTLKNLKLSSLLVYLGADVKSCWIPDGNLWGYEKPDWEMNSRALDFESGDGPDMILDYRGKMMRLICEGVKAEEEFEKTGKLSRLTSIEDLDSEAIWLVINNGLQTDPKKYHKIKDRLVGLCDPTTDGVKRLYRMPADATLPCPAINIKGSLAKIMSGSFDRSTNCGITARLEMTRRYLLAQDACLMSGSYQVPYNLENLYGYDDFEKLLDSKNIPHNSLQNLSRGIGIMTGSKVVVCGYEVEGRLAAAAMKEAGAHVIITETNPIPAYQATKDGFKVHNWEDVYQSADSIVTATGKKNFITVPNMKNMNNNTIIVDCGHLDNEIDIAGLEAYPGVQKIFLPNGYKWVFPETKNGIIVIVLPYGGPTSDVQTMIAVGLIELSKEKETGKYKNEVYVLPKEKAEYVAMLHLQELGAKLTKVPSSSSCTTAALEGQTYLCKRKAGLLNRLTLPNTKSKGE